MPERDWDGSHEARKLRVRLLVQRTRALCFTLALLVGSLALASGAIKVSLPAGVLVCGIGIASAGVVSGLLVRAHRLGRHADLDPYWLVLDPVLISWGVALSGGIDSPWYHWYLATMGSAAFVAGSGATAAVALWCGLCYLGTLAAVGHVTGLGAPLALAVTRLAFLDGAAFFFLWGVADLKEKRRLIHAMKEAESRKVEELRRLAAALDASARALSDANLKIREADRLKTQFLANVSHELRTPLNSIIGFSEILASQAFGPLGGDNYVEYARDIQVSGRHLLGVVNDILLMSKLDAGQHQIAIEEIALEEIVRESRRMVAADAKARGVDLKVCATCEPLEVLGGHQALRQILVNVLGNAVKFSPEGETVEIVWSRLNPAQCRLTIADRGCGMPADVIARLGKPFNQSDDSFTRSHQGSGLGLAISLGLAKAMDMGLDVSSEPGRGTTVSLTLRLAEGQRDAPAHRTLPPRDLPRAA